MPFLAWKRVSSAFAAMLLSAVASASAAAQDSTRPIATPDSLASWYRDPHTARILGSFIPGAGHFYAGENLRGLGLGGAALIGIGSGIVFLTYRDCPLLNFNGESCDSSVSTTNKVNGITQIAVGVAAWVFGAMDAPRAAERANEKARLGVSLAPVVREDAVRHLALGVAVTVDW